MQASPSNEDHDAQNSPTRTWLHLAWEFLLLSIIAAGVATLGYVLVSGALTHYKLDRELRSMQRELIQVEADLRDEELAIASLTQPENLEPVLQTLGYRPARFTDYVSLGPERGPSSP